MMGRSSLAQATSHTNADSQTAGSKKNDSDHGIWDYLGVAPIVGIPIDLVNGGAYAGEGQWGKALITWAGIIPIFGDWFQGGRLAATTFRKADNLLDNIAETAEAAADAARAAGRTTGAASELHAGGQVFVDVSTGGAPRVLNGRVQEALDLVPFQQRAPWHGACAEMGCLSQSLDAGVDPAGGWIHTVAIGSSNPGHALPKVACQSCASVLDQFGVTPR